MTTYHCHYRPSSPISNLALRQSALGQLALAKTLVPTRYLGALGLLALVNALELLADLAVDGTAGGADGCCVAVVGVDTGDVGLDVCSA